MVIVLWLVAILALANGVLVFVSFGFILLDMLINRGSSLQQIVALHVDIGLSLLVFATASGLATIISELRRGGATTESLGANISRVVNRLDELKTVTSLALRTPTSLEEPAKDGTARRLVPSNSFALRDE